MLPALGKRRLLRACRERPHSRGAADERDELAAPNVRHGPSSCRYRQSSWAAVNSAIIPRAVKK
jgi:hypothetical protein